MSTIRSFLPENSSQLRRLG